MANLKIEDEIDLRPRIKVTDIPNPHQIYPEIKHILTERLHINATDIDEQLYDHNKTGERETIRSVIAVQKSKDKFSKAKYKIKIDMSVRPVHKGDVEYVGDVDISLSAKIETKYSQDSPLKQSMIWHTFRSFYEKAIYKDVKKGYRDEAQENLQTLKEEIQSFFNLLPAMDERE